LRQPRNVVGGPETGDISGGDAVRDRVSSTNAILKREEAGSRKPVLTANIHIHTQEIFTNDIKLQTHDDLRRRHFLFNSRRVMYVSNNTGGNTRVPEDHLKKSSNESGLMLHFRISSQKASKLTVPYVVFAARCLSNQCPQTP
jgi:hypothetical protein